MKKVRVHMCKYAIHGILYERTILYYFYLYTLSTILISNREPFIQKWHHEGCFNHLAGESVTNRQQRLPHSAILQTVREYKIDSQIKY